MNTFPMEVFGLKKVTYHKKCKWCGKEFDTTSPRQMYCKDDYGECPVCGKKVKIKDYYVGVQCCSKECRQKRIERTCLERYGDTCAVNSEHSRKKARKTCLEKYGVEHYAQSDEFKEQFKKTMLERYGVENPLQSEEIKKRAQTTNIERYGGIAPTCDPEIMKKAIDTMIDRYGGVGMGGSLSDRIRKTMTERYGGCGSGSDIIKEKVLQTNLERYGVENPLQSEEIKAKVRQTNLERYGVECTLNNPDVHRKVIASNIERYGVENPFASEEVQQTIRDTLMERYGVDNPLKSDEIKDRVYATNLERYGTRTYNQSIISLQTQLSDPSKADNFIEFKNDIRSYIVGHFDTKPTLDQVAESIGVCMATVSAYITKTNCQDLIQYRPLKMESEIFDCIKEIVPDTAIILHTRSIISPYEIDMYLPEYKIGFECNPTYTHNSSMDAYAENDRKPIGYHRMKSDLAKKNGIFLFHIFGYEWASRKEQILSMIRNILGKTKTKIYARKTEIFELDNKTCCEFLEENHLQGFTNASVRLGLKYNGELVSVMTFNKIRGTIGYTDSVTENTYELSRFCNRLNMSVVGGASKLFKYFKDHYDFDEVISFADIAHVKGNLYETLGFKAVNVSDPSYCWSNPNNEHMINRVSAQKSNIQRLFPDENLDIEKHTESEIMISHGFVKVYDCGKIRYSYKP